MSDTLAERLARVETKIDLLLEDRGRLAAVEKKQWYHSGGIAAFAFILTKIWH